MDLSTMIDTAISLGTLVGMLGGGAGTVWIFFRKRIRAWWAPYKSSIKAMAEVPALHEGIEGLRRDVETVRSSVGILHLQFRARGDTNVESAEFECGPDGSNTYVNLTYARWLGVGKAELLGWGWVNFIHRDDREAVTREWDECRAQHRVFNRRYHIVDSDGATISVDTLITPIPDAPPAKQWLGVMRRVIA